MHVVYEFTLTLFGVSESDFDYDTVQALYEGGCGDASFVPRDGGVYLEFSRAAGSATEALNRAVGDVNRAGFLVADLASVDVKTTTLPTFGEGLQIDITGGMDSVEFIRRGRDEED